MNDPGLDSPIQDHAQAVEDEKLEEDLEEEDEQAFLNPRYEALLPPTDASLIILTVDGGLLPPPFLSWLYVLLSDLVSCCC